MGLDDPVYKEAEPAPFDALGSLIKKLDRRLDDSRLSYRVPWSVIVDAVVPPHRKNKIVNAWLDALNVSHEFPLAFRFELSQALILAHIYIVRVDRSKVTLRCGRGVTHQPCFSNFYFELIEQVRIRLHVRYVDDIR